MVVVLLLACVASEADVRTPAAAEVVDTLTTAIDSGDTASVDTLAVDDDGDGWTEHDGDCDDDENDVYPGASARECSIGGNGVDDDCDGRIDEDEPVPWYADTDRDNFGDPASAVEDCYPPSAHVADATDCDDTNAAVNPAAHEACNRTDDDCDGTVDEGTSTTDAGGTYTTLEWFIDRDGDGYGEPGSGTPDCERIYYGYDAEEDEVDGHWDLVELGTDCNDYDAAVFPGMLEACDGVDNDCDEAIDEGCE